MSRMTGLAYYAIIDEPEPNSLWSCSNCGQTSTYEELDDIEECILTPGDPSPAGRCPNEDCGALCYEAGGAS